MDWKNKGDVMAKFVLPELEYDYGELAPVISGEIMEVHHGKHHQGYVNNLNAALEKYAEAEAKGDLSAMIVAQKAAKFNGGGHFNHAFFWESLAPVNRGGGEKPEGELLKAIERGFGQLAPMIEQMNSKTIAVQGSGWGWLAFDKVNNRLVTLTTSNQDLVQEMGLVPLLCIDVWEHAYYLQYKNLRADFVKNIWKIVNWKRVATRYSAAIA